MPTFDTARNIFTINSATTLYVATTGSDTTGDGSQTKPWATVTAALNYLAPYEINAAVVISVGPGTFPAFSIQGLTFGASGSLKVLGDVTVLYTGTVATVTTVGTHQVITDNAAAFTINQYKGAILRDSSSIVAFGVYHPVVENTSNTVSVPDVALSVGHGYDILQLNTIFQSGGSTVPAVSLGQVFGSLLLSGTISASTGYALGIESCQLLNSVSGGGILKVTNSDCIISGCRIIASQAGLATTFTHSTFALMGCYIDVQYNVGGGVVTNLGNNQSIRSGFVRGNYFTKTSNTLIGSIGPSGPMSLIGNCIENVATAVSWSVQATANSGVGNWIKDCTTGIVCGVVLTAFTADFSGTVTTGVSVTNRGYINVIGGAISGTTGVSCATGGRCQVASTVTSTATTDLSVDGVTASLATMRAANPKTFPTTPNIYGSLVYE